MNGHARVRKIDTCQVACEMGVQGNAQWELVRFGRRVTGEWAGNLVSSMAVSSEAVAKARS